MVLVCDWRTDWEDPRLRPICPDIGVYDGLDFDPSENVGTLRVGMPHARTRMVVEVTSARVRANDLVAKVNDYQRTRVEKYVIIDLIARPARLLGYATLP